MRRSSRRPTRNKRASALTARPAPRPGRLIKWRRTTSSRGARRGRRRRRIARCSACRTTERRAGSSKRAPSGYESSHAFRGAVQGIMRSRPVLPAIFMPPETTGDLPERSASSRRLHSPSRIRARTAPNMRQTGKRGWRGIVPRHQPRRGTPAKCGQIRLHG